METNKMRDISREQFESWALSEGLSLNTRYGTYFHESTQKAWLSWQVSREAVVVELPGPNEVHDSGDYCAEAIDAIEAQGLKVAP